MSSKISIGSINSQITQVGENNIYNSGTVSNEGLELLKLIERFADNNSKGDLINKLYRIENDKSEKKSLAKELLLFVKGIASDVVSGSIVAYLENKAGL